jgi:hypothetical protein
MVSTCDGSVDAETAQPDVQLSPLPTLAQVFTSIRESRTEQTKLLCLLVAKTKLLCLLVTNSSNEGTTVGNAQDQT